MWEWGGNQPRETPSGDNPTRETRFAEEGIDEAGVSCYQ